MLCVHCRDAACCLLYRWPPAGVFEFGFEVVPADEKSKAPAGGRRYENSKRCKSMLDGHAVLAPHSGTACRAPTEIFCPSASLLSGGRMPVVPTTAYSQAEDALNLARALVNDSAGVVFTDTLLMPLLNSAYRGLQRELAENGVSVLGRAAGHRPRDRSHQRHHQHGNQRRLQPAASHRLPGAAHALGTRHGQHHGRFRAHGEIHQRRRDAESCSRARICGCGNGARTKSI